MAKFTAICLFVFAFIACEEAHAQWWLGGQSYALSSNKYDSYFGQAKPIIWNAGNPRGNYRWMPKCFTPSQLPVSCRANRHEKYVPEGYKVVCENGECYVVFDPNYQGRLGLSSGNGCGCQHCRNNRLFSRPIQSSPGGPARHSHHYTETPLTESEARVRR
jgi:hypothetical protein